MKTIIYIGGFELPDKNAAAHRVVNNAKALMELGYKIVFVDINRKCSKTISQTYSKCFDCDRYSMRYTNKRLFSIDDFIYVVNRYKETVAVIAYNYPAVALYRMKVYCNKNNINIYSDCTEWYGFQGDDLVHKFIKGVDSFLRMNIIQPKLDGMISISRYLEKYYQTKLPTICVPPLVDKTDKQWNMEYENLISDTIYIVYAGSPGRNKDKINKIIRALSNLSNYNFLFTIIGITKMEFIKSYPEEIETLKKIDDKVRFEGRVSHDEALKRIKTADFSMFYRDINRVTMAGFPTKFSEAISCGTPVITNKTSDIEEYLVDGINGFFINKSIEKTMAKIFKTNRLKIRSIKSEIDDSIFDYRNYISEFEKIFRRIT